LWAVQLRPDLCLMFLRWRSLDGNHGRGKIEQPLLPSPKYAMRGTRENMKHASAVQSSTRRSMEEQRHTVDPSTVQRQYSR
jgi:hypothetical protein